MTSAISRSVLVPKGFPQTPRSAFEAILVSSSLFSTNISSHSFLLSKYTVYSALGKLHTVSSLESLHFIDPKEYIRVHQASEATKWAKSFDFLGLRAVKTDFAQAMRQSIPMDPQDEASSTSSKSQHTAESSNKRAEHHLRGQETDPTSRPSLDTTYQKLSDLEEVLQETKQETQGLLETAEEVDHDVHASDEAEWGSLSLHSRATGSSSTSDDSRAKLPLPSTDARMEGIGSHLVNESSHRSDPGHDTMDAKEVQAMGPRFDRVTGIHLDILPRQTSADKDISSGYNCSGQRGAVTTFEPRIDISTQCGSPDVSFGR